MPISTKLRLRVAAQARGRCGYCQTQEIVSGIPLTLEHLIPTARGGQDVEENLWLSCRLCNERKAILTHALDAETSTTVPLYNPRAQTWSEHFTWDETRARIVGLTAIGRATLNALGLNDELRVRARALWVKAGYHPPAD